MNIMNTTMSMLMNMTAHHMMNHSDSMMDHAGHMMTTMDHSGHDMSGGDHSGHDMSGGDHSGHDMTGGAHSGHDMSGSDHSGHTMNHTGHEMKMYFHSGASEYILFYDLFTTSAGGMVGACIALFALSVFYEGLKYFREYLLRRATVKSNVYAPSNVNGSNPIEFKQPEVGSRMLNGSHFIQTLLHMVQVFLSYCLMLVFMTYNVWLCLAIVLGAGLGYFLFGWRRAVVVDLNEHCH